MEHEIKIIFLGITLLVFLYGGPDQHVYDQILEMKKEDIWKEITEMDEIVLSSNEHFNQFQTLTKIQVGIILVAAQNPNCLSEFWKA